MNNTSAVFHVKDGNFKLIEKNITYSRASSWRDNYQPKTDGLIMITTMKQAMNIAHKKNN